MSVGDLVTCSGSLGRAVCTSRWYVLGGVGRWEITEHQYLSGRGSCGVVEGVLVFNHFGDRGSFKPCRQAKPKGYGVEIRAQRVGLAAAYFVAVDTFAG